MRPSSPNIAISLCRALLVGALGLIATSTFATPVAAQIGSAALRPEIPPGTVPDEIPGVGVDERFDTAIPADAAFYDHTGAAVRLGELLHDDRPIVLLFVYHQCASFCDLVMRAVTDSLAQQPWTVGMNLTVITLSIDPRDTPEVLADARQRTLGRYGRSEAADGWFFLGGTEQEIHKVTEAVGYRYFWDAQGEQFAHPGVIMILQPSGLVSRYLYGLEFPYNDLRLAILDADEGRHSSSVEQFILYCYQWSHSDGRYVIAAWRLMRAGGFITLALVVGALLFFWRRELRKAPQRAAAAQSDAGRDELAKGGEARSTESAKDP